MTPLTYNLPENFKPFATLVICGNTFGDGRVLIEVNGSPFLFIGNGQYPLVWLSMPEVSVGSIDNITWIYAIKGNETTQSDYTITKIEGNTTIIKFKQKEILKVVKHDENSAEITKIDLRTVGLDIYGDGNTLNLGANKFTNNSFFGTHTMFNIGG
jgi:hypothetical protein